ncbi:MAG: aminotransferase class V-fold PLP-dependent enzyme, partial [Clostridia bacterium]|nr:aminotransferase class V-fold PLP-dependent enzyme [Clostridia bacterium]
SYIEGEALLLYLDMKGIAVSSGSACSSGSLSPSHVLTAMGLHKERLHSAIRMTLGMGNTMEDMDYVINVFKEKVAVLRAASPFFVKK